MANAQYEQFDAAHKKLRGLGRASKENDEPVTMVTWQQAVAFRKWLSEKEGQTYRLPTEAKWEFACRAGTTIAFHTGDTLTDKQANIAGDQKVDLTITPLASPKTGSTSGTRKRVIKTDAARTERIRNAKMPKIVAPVKFDTPEADAILSALEVFPPDHPINEVVTDWPMHPNSRLIVDSVGADKKLRYNPDMSFIIVPPDQKRIPVEITHYPGESDKGPFPIPDALPIEGWPVTFQRGQQHRDMTLLELQEDARKMGGDRHALVVDPTNRMLYEFYIAKRGKTGWQAAHASVFDLKINRMRPEGWTSTDATGLPVFPTVVRYDERKRGVVEHALRVTIRNTRRAFVYPARHYASRHENEAFPRMGERFRLRQDFDLTGFSPEVQAILWALKSTACFSRTTASSGPSRSHPTRGYPVCTRS